MLEEEKKDLVPVVSLKKKREGKKGEMTKENDFYRTRISAPTFSTGGFSGKMLIVEGGGEKSFKITS